MNTFPLPFIAAPTYASTQAWVSALQQAMPDARVVPFGALSAADKAGCTVAIVANPDPAAVRELPRLRWVHSVWAGVERLVTDLGDTDVAIVRLVDPQLAATMAEAVLAWTLYLHREMPAYARQQRQHAWRALAYVRPQRKRVGILGMGALARAAVKPLLAAGFQVAGWSLNRKEIPQVACYAGEAELPTMLAKTDILVCLLPLTRQTRGLLDSSKLGCLAPQASLINFARGPIIDEQALRLALDSGRIAHAVLDVFALEPLPGDQWQWDHPSVTVLPHCSAPTDMQSAAQIVAQNIARYRASGVLPDSVDIERGY